MPPRLRSLAVFVRLGLGLGALTCGGRAMASTADAVGLGEVESAVAGASAARVHDFSAGHYDPAGLTLADRPQATIGVTGLGAQLKIRSPDLTRTTGIADPLGIVIGAATPIPFVGALKNRLYLGIALYLVPDAVVRVISHRPEEPFYPLYDNRTQRLIVLPALAVRLPYGLSLGIGFNYLAGLDGRVTATEGAARAVEARLDEQIVSHLAVNAGIRWQATPRLALAAVYRQRFSVPFRTVSNNTVAAQAIDISVDAEGLFTPHEVVLGAAVQLRPHTVLSLDVEWQHWSEYQGPYVTVSSDLPLVGTIAAQPPKVAFTDAAALRLGAEWSRPVARSTELTVRGGYAFISSPVPAEQSGVTNLLDGHRHRLAVGLGVHRAFSAASVRLDAHGQLEALQPVTMKKRFARPGDPPDPAHALSDEIADDPQKPASLGLQTSNPGYPSIGSGGFVWAAGVQLTVAR
jgi:long-subunit fatty acid transport protein